MNDIKANTAVFMTLPDGTTIHKLKGFSEGLDAFMQARASQELITYGDDLEKLESPSAKLPFAKFYSVQNQAGRFIAGLLGNPGRFGIHLLTLIIPREEKNLLTSRLSSLMPLFCRENIDVNLMYRILGMACDENGTWYPLDKLPEGFTHRGDLKIQPVNGMTVELPRNMHVKGNLWYSSLDPHTCLPDNLTVDKDLNLTSVYKFSDGTKVSGCLTMRNDKQFPHCKPTVSVGDIHVQNGFKLNVANLSQLPDTLLDSSVVNISTTVPFQAISNKVRKYKELFINVPDLKMKMPECIHVSDSLNLSFKNGNGLPRFLSSEKITYINGVTGFPSLKDWSLKGFASFSNSELENLPDDLDLNVLELNRTVVAHMPKSVNVSRLTLSGRNLITIETTFNMVQRTPDSKNKIEIHDTNIREIPGGMFPSFKGSIWFSQHDFLPRLPKEFDNFEIEICLQNSGPDYFITGRFTFDKYCHLREKLCSARR